MSGCEKYTSVLLAAAFFISSRGPSSIAPKKNRRAKRADWAKLKLKNQTKNMRGLASAHFLLLAVDF
jgi:hypothetical protein